MFFSYQRSKLCVFGNYVVAGSSDKCIYCISAVTGKLIWKSAAGKAVIALPVTENSIVYIGSSNRMFSPAACYSVAAHNRVFIVAPDQYMISLDAATGKVLWREKMPGTMVRESMGLSTHSSTVSSLQNIKTRYNRSGYIY